jgi:hypothetical protein
MFFPVHYSLTVISFDGVHSEVLRIAFMTWKKIISLFYGVCIKDWSLSGYKPTHHTASSSVPLKHAK